MKQNKNEPSFFSSLLSTFSMKIAKKNSGLSSEDLSSINTELYLDASARNRLSAIIIALLGLFYFFYDLFSGIYSNGFDKINILGFIGVILYFVPAVIFLALSIFVLPKHPKAIRASIDVYYLAVFSGAMIFFYKDFLSFEGAIQSGFSFASFVFVLFCFIPLINNIDWLVLSSLELGIPYLLRYLAGTSTNFTSTYQSFIVTGIFLLGSLSIRTLNFNGRTVLYKNRLANMKLQSLMARDTLTGVSNRYALALDEKEYLKQNYIGDNFFFMLDIDDFKLYNDSFSHLKGDECLRLVSQSINNVLLGHSLKLYRVGGEEFLSFGHCTKKEAIELALEIKSEVAKLKITAPKEYARPFLTISLGVGEIEGKVTNFKNGIEEADKALYFSKNNGRDTCSYKEVTFSTEEEIKKLINGD